MGGCMDENGISIPLLRFGTAACVVSSPLPALTGFTFSQFQNVKFGTVTEMGNCNTGPDPGIGGCHEGRVSVPVGTSECTHWFEV